ncbi:MAG TPA: UPF0182 family protein, partial [Acidobacteriota bacterium]|nr:UPF0182 family protein [Acidobacteriota bacterium]
MSETTQSGPDAQRDSNKIETLLNSDSRIGLEALPFIPSPALLWRAICFWIWAAYIALLLAAIPHIIVDYWFFDSIHKTSIFWTNFNAQLILFIITMVAFALADYLPIQAYAVSPTLKKAALHLGMWSGLFAGWMVSRNYQELLLFLHAVPFGKTDPIFGYDIGFYVFKLPAIRIFLGILVAAGLDTAFAFIIARYDQLRCYGLFDRQDISFWAKCGMMITPGLNYALTLLGISLVGETFISRYALLLKDNEASGVRVGAEYLDINGILSVLNMINLSTAIEFGLMASFGYALYRISKHYEKIVRRSQSGDDKETPVELEVRRPFRIGLALLAIDLLFFCGVVLKQHIFVNPNEPNIQIPYIQRHMDATLEGYHLNKVETVEWIPPKDKVPSKELNDSKTVQNAPVLPSWQSYMEEPPDVQHYERLALDKDKLVFGPMLQIYRQEQQLRPYYGFISVDGVRYTINGERQMFVSAVRELPSLA